MAKKLFYSHLIETTDITLEIANLNVTSKERVHLLSLVHANIHNSVVSKILSNLDPEDKKIFLENLSNENHEKTWTHLKTKMSNIQEDVEKTIKDTIKELIKDIKKVKA